MLTEIVVKWHCDPCVKKGLHMEELESAEPVQVELACGSTMLWKKPGSMTLLSKDEVEPIIPLRMLVENGYMLKCPIDRVRLIPMK